MDHPTLLVVGTIVAIAAAAVVVFVSAKASKKATALEDAKKEWINLPLVKKTVISHNTAIYRLSLPKADQPLGLPIGQHIQVAATINGKELTRSYTPVSSDDDIGYVDLLIKSYPTGNISKYFAELKLNDLVKIKGPKGFFIYTPNMTEEFVMIAGGTGITPMYQIIKAILKNPDEKTKITLIFANVNEEDILLRDELEQSAKDPRFNVKFVLNNPPAGWTGGVGFVTKDIVAEFKPKPEKTRILLCGPPPMMTAMAKITEELGFPKVWLVPLALYQQFIPICNSGPNHLESWRYRF
ncbi:NADH-cytochrome b5 reductase 1 [Zopfochytrium polystomum]|nr:NADH-cytochrome b5 reductase 1 [Zopfochytrium polystomum]